MKTEIVKTWIETYYVHPEGYHLYKPKNLDNLITKNINCNIIQDMYTKKYTSYCDDIEGGPIMSGDSIEECEKKFKEAFLISIYFGGLISADTISIEKTLRDFIFTNPKYLTDYKSGKTALIGLFVGHVMKERKGKGDPKMILEITKNFLEKL